MKSKFLAVTFLVLACSPFGYADVAQYELTVSDVSYIERNDGFGTIVTSYFGGKQHKFSVNADEGKEESQNFSQVKLQLIDEKGSSHQVKVMPSGTVCTPLGYPDQIYNCIAVVTQQSPANPVSFSMVGVDGSGQEIKLADGIMPELSAELVADGDGKVLIIKSRPDSEIKITEIKGDSYISIETGVGKIDVVPAEGIRLPLVLSNCNPKNKDTDFLNNTITLKCKIGDKDGISFRIGIRCICSANPNKLSEISKEVISFVNQIEGNKNQTLQADIDAEGFVNATQAANNATDDYNGRKTQASGDITNAKLNITKAGYKLQDGGVFSKKITVDDVKKEAEGKKTGFDQEKKGLEESQLGKYILELQGDMVGFNGNITNAKNNTELLNSRNGEKERTSKVMGPVREGVNINNATSVLLKANSKHDEYFGLYNTTQAGLSALKLREQWAKGNSTTIDEVNLPQVNSWISGNSTEHNRLQQSSGALDVAKQKPLYERSGRSYAKKQHKCDASGEVMFDAVNKK